MPVAQSKFLLKLLQLDLQAHPPDAPVTAVRIVAIPTRSRTRQLGLFLPLSPEPEVLGITLARIQSAVGEGRVGSPVLEDSHRPGAFRQEKFVLPEASLRLSSGEQQARSALRIYRPPLAAAVELQDKRPVSLSLRKCAARTVPEKEPAPQKRTGSGGRRRRGRARNGMCWVALAASENIRPMVPRKRRRRSTAFTGICSRRIGLWKEFTTDVR